MGFVKGAAVKGVFFVPSTKSQFHLFKFPALATEASKKLIAVFSQSLVLVVKLAVGKGFINTDFVSVSLMQALSVSTTNCMV